MKKFIAIFITALTLCGCSSSSSRKETGGGQPVKKGPHVEVDTSKLLKTRLRVEELKFLHTFIGTEGEILGKLYGKEINDSIYSDFLIVKEINGKLTPIYAIEKATFQNTNGKENIPISNDNFFYGYKLLVKTNNDMDIELHSKRDGRIYKADPITILWDKSEKVFKVLITP